MLVALVVGVLLLCFVNAQLTPSPCDVESCWRPPATSSNLLEGQHTTEETALVAVKCYLSCPAQVYSH